MSILRLQSSWSISAVFSGLLFGPPSIMVREFHAARIKRDPWRLILLLECLSGASPYRKFDGGGGGYFNSGNTFYTRHAHVSGWLVGGWLLRHDSQTNHPETSQTWRVNQLFKKKSTLLFGRSGTRNFLRGWIL